jgi:hypothetical protein
MNTINRQGLISCMRTCTGVGALRAVKAFQEALADIGQRSPVKSQEPGSLLIRALAIMKGKLAVGSVVI